MKNIALVNALFAKQKYPVVEILYEMNGNHLTCGPFEEGSPEFAEAENTIFDRGGRVIAVEELETENES